ncbi:MAG: transglutaminase domain-containing protein, partial [Muribaculaceae bacterium]|nr:transglutaminase domain-containing protein [Muribaculaceae bacterium]
MNKLFPLALTALLAAASACNKPSSAPSRQECLEFLQTYMPMPDTADLSTEFLLANIDASLRARAEMPWGDSVPEREWRHFVLPMRVNNEWIDSARMLFYEELKPRVQGLSMKDAILEVNHWCHEKATYQPSDSRTHSPLMTVYTHLGRCGEESTFAVAALRSVGIPARQVYTPRWAHTDDNHAWVEAWADGQWWFLGACEPEPVLNLGWFNSAAARGVLMNTRVIGADYDGPEEVLARTDQYVEINVTSNYAPVDTLHVTVLNADGTPATGSTVTFRLYNYGELYPIATKQTDNNGHAYLIAGLGDIVVWTADSTGTPAYAKSRPGSSVTLTLGSAPEGMQFDIVPPVAGGSTPDVTPEQSAENERRKALEDSIRTAEPFHHAVPDEFIASVPENDRKRTEALVASLSTKDRRDVTMEVLRDHFSTPVVETPLYTDYILCPRIASEELSPWRGFFAETLCAGDSAGLFREQPQLWADWVSRNIDGTLQWYPASVTIHPATMWKLRRGNSRSRDIFFVAGARSLGIPARIDPVTSAVQWANANGQWITVDFDADNSAPEALQQSGDLKLTYSKVGSIDDPKYYVNFTLSRIGEDGMPRLLEYPEDATWSQMFRNGVTLDAGNYMLVTGQRLADGTVLAATKFFEVKPSATVTLPIEIRQDNSAVQVIGSFNAENLYRPADGSAPRSLLSTAGRGYYVVGLINPNHEPSAHVLNDLIAEAPALEKWGRSIILLFDSEESQNRFDASRFSGLPSNVTFGTDIDGTIAAELTEAMKLNP